MTRPECKREVDSLTCDLKIQEEREVGARLVALGHRPARSWKEAVIGEAWRCTLAGSSHEGTSRGVALWNGEVWAIGDWDLTTPLTACMDELQTTSPAPDQPVRVMLTLEFSDGVDG